MLTQEAADLKAGGAGAEGQSVVLETVLHDSHGIGDHLSSLPSPQSLSPLHT